MEMLAGRHARTALCACARAARGVLVWRIAVHHCDARTSLRCDSSCPVSPDTRLSLACVCNVGPNGPRLCAGVRHACRVRSCRSGVMPACLPLPYKYHFWQAIQLASRFRMALRLATSRDESCWLRLHGRHRLSHGFSPPPVSSTLPEGGSSMDKKGCVSHA